VAVPASDGRRDPATGVLNLNALQSFSRRLAHVLDAPLADDRFPLVIGGDCAILLGICGALAARQPSAGLVFFDTHGDFQLPAIACTACRSG
jgi:arginase